MVAKEKPNRGTSLVVSAIRKLRDVQGTSSREIMNFISSEYDVSGSSLKRHVQMALRRGMSYGIIQRAKKGGYYLSNPKGLTISCDDLVDRGRRGGCKGRKKRRRSRRRKCGRRRSRRARKRRGKKCRGKKRRRARRGKKRCGRRGRRRGGDDEMDEMAVTLGRSSPRKPARLGRSKYQERSGTRSKSPSDRSSATRSSGGSTPIDNPTDI